MLWVLLFQQVMLYKYRKEYVTLEKELCTFIINKCLFSHH